MCKNKHTAESKQTADHLKLSNFSFQSSLLRAVSALEASGGGGSLPQIVGMRGCVSGYGSITIAVVYTNISGCVPPTHQISEGVSPPTTRILVKG